MSKKNILSVFCILILMCLFMNGCNSEITTPNEEISSDEAGENELFASVESLEDNLRNICKYIRCYKAGERDERDSSIEYISQKFTEYGYTPSIQEFDIYDLSYSTSTNGIPNLGIFFHKNPYDEEKIGDGKNIIINHTNNKGNQKAIYITAHYDTTANTVGTIDNGTGTVVVMEIAKIMEHYDGPLNIVFVLFDSEEKNQQGSREFVRNMSEEEKQNTIGCINIDMVGEIDAGEIEIACGRGEYNILSLMLANHSGNTLKTSHGVLTDDLPFYYGKMPAVTLTNSNSNFKLDKEPDQFQYIDFAQLKSVTDFISEFISTFDEPYYTETLNNQRTVNSNTSEMKAPYIENAVFLISEAKPVENGYDFETIFTYNYNNTTKLKITRNLGKFYAENDYSDFEISKSENKEHDIVYYKYIDNETDENQLIYYSSMNYGILSGAFTKDEFIQILTSYQNYVYFNIQ